MRKDILFIIPARGGSKGIPNKNIRPLGGKPLIHYSIEFARQFVSDDQICLSTDSTNIIDCARQIGYHCKFTRPTLLATDQAGTFPVLQHALSIYNVDNKYKMAILLQPTSPFRKKLHLEEAISYFSSDLDMVVSVSLSDSNPYFNLFEENSEGFLSQSKGNGQYNRRQDTPAVYQYNGSFYIINIESIKKHVDFKDFTRIKKYIMNDIYHNIDIDTQKDWLLAEFILKSKPY